MSVHNFLFKLGYFWFIENSKENTNRTKIEGNFKNIFKINKLFLYLTSNS